MKIIILSLLVGVFSINANAQISEQLCRLLPASDFNTASMTAIKCAQAAPTYALFKKFEKSFPNISFERTVHDDSDVVWTQFGVNGYQYYVKKDKSGKVEFMQGLPDAECHYKYEIFEGGRDKKTKFCNAIPPDSKGMACLQKWAKDPIRNPRKTEKSCNVFLESMVSCMDEKSECQKNLYARMNESDKNAKPKINSNAMPRPTSDGSGGSGKR